MSGPRMQIGEVAERVSLSLRTIRYYDEVGVVTPSARTKGGFRLYTEDDIARLLLVKCMKPLDFTLDEMRDFLQTLDEHTRAAGRAGAEASSAPATDDGPPEQLSRIEDRLAMYRSLLSSRVDALTVQLRAARRLSEELDARVGEVPPEPEPGAEPGSPAAQERTHR